MGMGCQPSILESTVDDSEIRSDSEMQYESALEGKKDPPSDVTMDMTAGVAMGTSMVDSTDDSISFNQTSNRSRHVIPENTEPVGEETKLLESSKDVQISKQVRTEDESGLLKVLKLYPLLRKLYIRKII